MKASLHVASSANLPIYGCMPREDEHEEEKKKKKKKKKIQMFVSQSADDDNNAITGYKVMHTTN
jgi:hypothetical protein